MNFREAVQQLDYVKDILPALQHGVNHEPRQTLIECVMDYFKDRVVPDTDIKICDLLTSELEAHGKWRIEFAIKGCIDPEETKNQIDYGYPEGSWLLLAADLLLVYRLAALKDGLQLAFNVFQGIYFPFFWGFRSYMRDNIRDDLVMLFHDEALYLCKYSLAPESPLTLHKWQKELLEGFGPIRRHHRKITANDFFPRSMRFIRERRIAKAKKVKVAITTMTEKAIGPHLPPEIVLMIQDQILFDRNLPVGDVSPKSVWDAAFKPWKPQCEVTEREPKDCCDSARASHEDDINQHRILWSHADNAYIWYHLVSRTQPFPFVWVRCGAQPRPSVPATQSDEYLYGFICQEDECFEHDPDGIAMNKINKPGDFSESSKEDRDEDPIPLSDEERARMRAMISASISACISDDDDADDSNQAQISEAEFAEADDAESKGAADVET